jgi:hypothetical protein
MDGKKHIISRSIKNDRPNTKDIDCPCGGKLYAAAKIARCSEGELRCTICLRPVRKFGKGYTCGIGCVKT